MTAHNNVNKDDDKEEMAIEDIRQLLEKRYLNQIIESTISRKVINGDFQIGDPQRGARAIENLKFVDCVFNGSIKVKTVSAGKVIFENCEFHESADFDHPQVTFEGRCVFTNLSFYLE